MKRQYWNVLFTFMASMLFANISYSFGVAGSSGRDGRWGTSGRSGEDVTVYASGQRRNVYAAGERGFAGGDGGRGYNATSCNFGRPDRNTYGARGGNGGDGGRGGWGGNGGDVTIYAGDISFLSQLTVIADGGQGGQGGTPGRAGRGCGCNPQSWTKEKCRSVSNGNGETRRECTETRYYCQRGPNGSRGRYGTDGSEGSYGSIKVYLSEDRPAAAINQLRVDLSRISDDPYTLSYDVWETRRDARYVLAPGSRVNSSYEIWTGQEFKSVTVKWQAEADPALFAGEEIVLEYSKSGFNYRYPRGAWVQINYDANASVITIVDAMKWSEAQKASWVAPGKDQIWLLNGTKNLRKTNNDQFFQEMPGSGSRIAIGPSGKIYGIDSFTNVIYKFVDEAWESYTGDRAKRLAAGPKSLFTIDLFNNIWQRDHENDSWIPLNDKSSEIAIGPKGDLWSIYLNGDVYERVNGDWIKRGIKASRISVGPEGPWVVDKQGSAYKYMGSNRWENIAGGVKEVAVRENGEVYGIAPGNFLMKFQGEYFRPLEK